LLAHVDDNLARARLEPYARDRILAPAGGISTALVVELLLAQHRGDLRTLGRDAIGRNGFGRSLDSSGRRRSIGNGRNLGLWAGQFAQIGKGFLVGHYAPTLFLRFIDATSRIS